MNKMNCHASEGHHDTILYRCPLPGERLSTLGKVQKCMVPHAAGTAGVTLPSLLKKWPGDQVVEWRGDPVTKLSMDEATQGHGHGHYTRECWERHVRSKATTEGGPRKLKRESRTNPTASGDLENILNKYVVLTFHNWYLGVNTTSREMTELPRARGKYNLNAIAKQ